MTRSKDETPTIELWPIDKPKPYAQNPRKIGEQAIAGVAQSIKSFGFKNPIVVDGEGVVINGHTRLLAAKRLGLKKVPVLVATDLTPEQARAFRIADNRTGEFSDWDRELLALEMPDLRELLAFANIEELLAISPVATEPAINPTDEWKGMPEFSQEDKTAFKQIVVHFPDQAAVDQFAALLDKKILPTTRYLWFPELVMTRQVDKRYGVHESETIASETSDAQP